MSKVVRPQLDRERLVIARVTKGLTQEHLAYEVGLSISAIRKYEQGLSSPSAKNLLRLAQRLGHSTDWLLGHDVPS